MGSGTFAFGADFGMNYLARKNHQSSGKPSGYKTDHSGKRLSTRHRETPEPVPVSIDSGRSSHREHQRSEEPDHEPHRGEISPGQEP
jgi:hypothetical protein